MKFGDLMGLERDLNCQRCQEEHYFLLCSWISEYMMNDDSYYSKQINGGLLGHIFENHEGKMPVRLCLYASFVNEKLSFYGG